MSDAKAPQEKPQLTWIDVAITVTLVASIVGMAAWLLSGRFSYVAAPASSFGLVNLLKKPKSDESGESEASEASEASDGSAPSKSTDGKIVDTADTTDRGPTTDTAIADGGSTIVSAPLPLIENPNLRPTLAEPNPIESPDALGDPFDGSLLELAEPSAPVPTTNPMPAPAPATIGTSEGPIRTLRDRYATGAKDFQRFDLRNVELNYAELRLVGADLREVKAERASLQQIDLTEANLGRGDFRYAKLDGANLSYTNLSAANLSGASLRAANLRDARLNDAQLALADLSYADLSGADLSGADLTDTNFFRARLDGAKLPVGMARP